mmetsp:Transcript_7872/g.26016  ORF Transcript_7872/g.26016 Transcript_7872/m.26016 type:complete len:214 (-) Transcript_7872:899-1540(-)
MLSRLCSRAVRLWRPSCVGRCSRGVRPRTVVRLSRLRQRIGVGRARRSLQRWKQPRARRRRSDRERCVCFYRLHLFLLLVRLSVELFLATRPLATCSPWSFDRARINQFSQTLLNRPANSRRRESRTCLRLWTVARLRLFFLLPLLLLFLFLLFLLRQKVSVEIQTPTEWLVSQPSRSSLLRLTSNASPPRATSSRATCPCYTFPSSLYPSLI